MHLHDFVWKSNIAVMATLLFFCTVLAAVLLVLDVPSLVIMRQNLNRTCAREPYRVVRLELSPSDLDIDSIRCALRQIVPGNELKQIELHTPGQGTWHEAINPNNWEVTTTEGQTAIITLQMRAMGNPRYLWPLMPERESVIYSPVRVHAQIPLLQAERT